ncbi:hypothetical protein CDCA_CDCA05G1710 [Cyanidium caldarium]|uniref:Amino acid transporter transmembrane domain-containing protein n=1 Tax=Cyanidium caldarium TaxID=2771 RepID=A0AAV9ITR4_CYACA|nr:hypothetical protein CDCA_CDCA05G1710 [Cyanidium caldarium]
MPLSSVSHEGGTPPASSAARLASFAASTDPHCGVAASLSTYFLTIATVLGTGVLGLPVSLYRCGVRPFLVWFTVTVVAQCGTVYGTVELLQRAQRDAALRSRETRVIGSNAVGEEMEQGELDGAGVPAVSGKQAQAISQTDLWLDGDIAAAAVSRNNHADLYGSMEAVHITMHHRRGTGSSHRSSSSSSSSGSGGPLRQASPASSVAVASARRPHPTDKHRWEATAAAENGIVEETGPAPDRTSGPSLYEMGEMYLPYRSLRWAFEASVFLHFVSILISYALAGPQAYAQLFRGVGVRHLRPHPALSSASSATAALAPDWAVALFCLLCTTALLFCLNAVLPVLTVATGLKATLLVVIVLLVGVIGAQVGHSWHNRWSAWAEPFLVGTVALGGIATVMPVTYARLGGQPSTTGVRRYRAAVIGGLLTCYVLNVVWCVSVLAVVPQTAPLSPSGNATAVPSLDAAQQAGEISTIPLVQTLELRGMSSVRVVDALVNLFITVSITVSFLVVGAGLRHMIDGVVAMGERKEMSREDALSSAASRLGDRSASTVERGGPGDDAEWVAAAAASGPERLDGGRRSGLPFKALRMNGTALAPVVELWHRPSVRRYVLYATFYGFILVMALLNPHGFLAVMAGFTSLGLNLACGVFVALMLLCSAAVAPRPQPDGPPTADAEHDMLPDAATTVPLPLPRAVARAVAYGCLGFFGFAVAADAFWWLPHRLFSGGG